MGPKFDMGHSGPRRFAIVMLVLTSIKTRGRTFFHSITGQSANRASLGKHRPLVRLRIAIKRRKPVNYMACGTKRQPALRPFLDMLRERYPDLSPDIGAGGVTRPRFLALQLD
jgi:hypothetical protein